MTLRLLSCREATKADHVVLGELCHYFDLDDPDPSHASSIDPSLRFVWSEANTEEFLSRCWAGLVELRHRVVACELVCPRPEQVERGGTVKLIELAFLPTLTGDDLKSADLSLFNVYAAETYLAAGARYVETWLSPSFTPKATGRKDEQLSPEQKAAWDAFKASGDIRVVDGLDGIEMRPEGETVTASARETAHYYIRLEIKREDVDRARVALGLGPSPVIVSP